MPFGIMNSLNVSICDNAADAIQKGFTYPREAGFKPVTIDKVVVVLDGTEAGNPTVDFVLMDEEGNKYVVMVTGNLLKAIPC